MEKNKLVCHFYCMGYCKFDKCKFLHPKKKPFACPNGRSCPIQHRQIPCPYLSRGYDCEKDDCEFRHSGVKNTYNQYSDSEDDDIYNKKEKSKPQNKKEKYIKVKKEASEQSKIQGKPLNILDDESDKFENKRKIIKTKPQQDEEIQLEKPVEKVKIYEKEEKKIEQEDIEEEKVQLDEKPQQKQIFEPQIEYNFEQRIRELHQDLEIFQPLQQESKKQIKAPKSLDLLFIMDCTGSMGSWIKICKDELKNIINQVSDQFTETDIRLGFVAYRDHCDGEQMRLVVKEFTKNLDSMIQFISKLQPYGGGDSPEDIAGGLNEALKMKWQAEAKYAVLIADCPCHGKKYHNVDDSYPNGDPHGLEPIDQVKEFAKKGIDLYAIKITSMTDKMYDILQQHYELQAGKPLLMADLGQSTSQFAFFIVETVGTTLNTNKMGENASMIKRAIQMLKEQKHLNNQLTKKQKTEILKTLIEEAQKKKNNGEEEDENDEDMDEEEFDELKLKIMKGKPNWNSLQNSKLYEKAICHTFFIVKDQNVAINWKKPLVQNSQITTKIRICKEPFSQGAMRYAFYAKDELLNQNIVAKLPKQISKDYNLQTLQKDLESIFICQHLVNEYNESLIPLLSDTKLLLNFVHCFIYQLDPSQTKYIYYQAENYIDGTYTKYNNNAGWINLSASASAQISQTFSHFSWQLTEGYLMIVDLQGVAGVLTDPQIHCLDYSRFGKGNLGYEGIMKFFYSHKCNSYCKQLSLLHPSQHDHLPKDFSFFSQKMKIDPYKTINTLCDLCKKPFQISGKVLQDKQNKSQEKYCPSCDDKRKSSMKSANCIECGTKFTSSQYWFLMKRTDFPERCGPCRRSRRDRLRKELEEQEKLEKQQQKK